jgi:catechol 2,3-dioxygenase-like lactoylglutathione lyase family enzyme
MTKAIKINHVTLLVKDKNKAEKFYTEILGLEKHAVGNSLWIRVGSQFIHISENSGEPRKGSFYHFAIEFENVIEYAKKLVEKGIKVFDLDKELNEILINAEFEKPQRQFFIRDVDDNLIELVEANSQFFNPII